MKKGGSKASLASEAENNGTNGGGEANGVVAALAEFELNDRSTTGVLTSHPQSRDIHFESFSLLYHGHELLTDTSLELNYGRCAAGGGAGGRRLVIRLPCVHHRPRRAQALRAHRPQWVRQELPAQGAGRSRPAHPRPH